MDAAKTTFLFGTATPGCDLDDPDQWSALLRRHHGDDSALQSAVRDAVATQILQDQPPETWQAAQRLLDQGLDGQDVLRELVLTFTPYVLDALGGEHAFDTERYAESLSRLPLPSADAVREALLAAAGRLGRASTAELIADAAGALGVVADDSGVQALLERLLDDLLDEASHVQMLAGDLIVDVRGLLEGAVLTTVLAAPTTDLLRDAWVDLAAFDQLDAEASPWPTRSRGRSRSGWSTAHRTSRRWPPSLLSTRFWSRCSVAATTGRWRSRGCPSLSRSWCSPHWPSSPAASPQRRHR